MSRLVVVGDALLDRDVVGRAERLAPDAPVAVVDEHHVESRPGGAALAAVMAACDGHDVTLVTAIGGDGPGDELRGLLERRDVTICDLELHGPTPEKIRVHAERQPLLRLDRGGRDAPCGPLGDDARAALTAADAVLAADYGRGVCAAGDVRTALRDAAAARPLVWDPHARGMPPVPGTRCATPNAREAARIAGVAGEAARIAGDGSALALSEQVLDRWPADAVCVTHGARGAVVAVHGRPPVVVPADPVTGDPCGAGDRFASALVAALAGEAELMDAVAIAVARASAFVREGGVATLTEALPRWDRPPAFVTPHSLESAVELAGRVRARGGTVVATGGCFDLLHAGHARLLDAARRLGDALVVLVNGDDSVRRLKGAARPVNPAADRAALLAAMGSVDAVAIFDDDTPVQALTALAPDIWVKGGEYEHRALPEAETVAAGGGRVVLVPQLTGRSTTRLMEEIKCRAAM